MNLRIACGLLALVLATGLAHAQNNRTPVYQSGRMTPGDLAKFVTNGLIGDISGLTGDTLGTGANPFSIYDRNGIGLSFNTGPSSGPYQALQLGHDASGNALLSLRSFNGAAETGLNCDIYGSITSCFGISPLSALTIADQTVLGNLSGVTGNPYAVTLSDLFGLAFRVPDPPDTYADDTSYVVLTNNSRGDAREKIRLDTLVHHQQVHFWPVNLRPMMIDAATAGDENQVFGSGPLIFDVSHISFGEDFVFSTQAFATAYLDAGPLWSFDGGFPGQMVRVNPNETVTIRRLTAGIFSIVSSHQNLQGYPLVNLPVNSPNGQQEFCTNCRNPGEGAAAGSGAWVTRNTAHSAWYLLGVAATQ